MENRLRDGFSKGPFTMTMAGPFLNNSVKYLLPETEERKGYRKDVMN